MTKAQLYTMLSGIVTNSSGRTLPTAYRCFNTPQTLPFAVYIEDGTDNFAADGIVYESIVNVDVELYTDAIDTTAQLNLEAAFTTAGIFYNRMTEWLDDEHCYEITYTITL